MRFPIKTLRFFSWFRVSFNTLRLTLFTFFLASCSLIAPPATVPSYIRVQSYAVVVNPLLNEGTKSSNITDIWVDENSDFRGIYQLPVSVPILNTGAVTISLQAVVQEDGIASNLLPYPFYTIYKKNVNLQAGKLDTISPVFYYDSVHTKFAWPEGNFEGSSNPLKTTSQNTANVFVTSVKDSVFEGLKSCEIDFSTGHDTFFANSYIAFTPPSTDVVWLEMNYKTDIPMDVGILSIPSGTNPTPVEEFVSGVNPTSTWKKVYINIGPALQYFNQNPFFQIYFYANASGKAHILIDNLKLLYLE